MPTKKKTTSAKLPDKREAVKLIFLDMIDGMSLRKACVKRGVPASTVIDFVNSDKELAEQYAHARARLIEYQAEELEEIGERAASAETAVEVAGLRLQSDNRKWLLSKLAPKKYGDRITHAGDETSPLQVQATIYVPKKAD